MRDRTTYDGRYRRKLNMLGPGTGMLKCAAALAAAGAVLAALLVLVAVELHQDRVLNEIAARERARAEEKR